MFTSEIFVYLCSFVFRVFRGLLKCLLAPHNLAPFLILLTQPSPLNCLSLTDIVQWGLMGCSSIASGAVITRLSSTAIVLWNALVSSS